MISEDKRSREVVAPADLYNTGKGKTSPLFTRRWSMIRFHAVVSLLTIMFGCLSCSVTETKQPHIIINREGYPVTVSDQETDVIKRQRFQEKVDEILKTVADNLNTVLCVVDSGRQEKKPDLMIIVHGGLTTYSSGLDYIKQIVDPSTGCLKGTHYYPIFINWDSSFLTAMEDDLFEIRNGERNPIVAGVTFPFWLVHHLVTGFIMLPFDVGFRLDSDKAIFEKAKEGEEIPLHDRLTDGAKTIVTLPTRMASLALIRGFGTPAWEMMKRRVDQMIAVRIRPETLLGIGREERPGALRTFLRAFKKKLNSEGIWRTSDGRDVPITLVGHSMGAMVIDRILTQFPEIHFQRIIYLAPAGSIKEFQQSVIPYLKVYKNTSFYSFSLAVKDETGETNPQLPVLNVFPLNDFLPRGSLLSWIDDLFDPVLSPEDRRLGSFENKVFMELDEDDPKLCSRMVFIKFTGRAEDPRRHAELNDDGKLQAALKITEPGGIENFKTDCPKCVVYHLCPST